MRTMILLITLYLKPIEHKLVRVILNMKAVLIKTFDYI